MKQDKPTAQVAELLMQSLAHEKGGVKVYETAVRCAVNGGLKEEWSDWRRARRAVGRNQTLR